MALTTHIESGFQCQLKTGVVFLDLSAAYDTVWRDGLMLKFKRTDSTICCQTASFKYSSENRAADDIALTHQARKCEIHQEEGLETLSRFFHQWRLRPNPSKTEVCVFHLGTHNANRKLTVQFDNTLITHVDYLKYFGMTLDRTFSLRLRHETSLFHDLKSCWSPW
jgi:hypothetical protein